MTYPDFCPLRYTCFLKDSFTYKVEHHLFILEILNDVTRQYNNHNQQQQQQNPLVNLTLFWTDLVIEVNTSIN